MGNIAKGCAAKHHSRTDTKAPLVWCELFQETKPVIALKKMAEVWELEYVLYLPDENCEAL